MLTGNAYLIVDQDDATLVLGSRAHALAQATIAWEKALTHDRHRAAPIVVDATGANLARCPQVISMLKAMGVMLGQVPEGAADNWMVVAPRELQGRWAMKKVRVHVRSDVLREADLPEEEKQRLLRRIARTDPKGTGYTEVRLLEMKVYKIGGGFFGNYFALSSDLMTVRVGRAHFDVRVSDARLERPENAATLVFSAPLSKPFVQRDRLYPRVTATTSED